jgi:hypothetical protein
VEIKEFAVRFKYLKPVGEALGDNHHTGVVRRKFLGVPVQKSRRPTPKIDGHVPDSPT